MRLLLTNDDGIDAPGLEALQDAVESLGSVQVVAPLGPCSGGGHQVTTHRPLRLHLHGTDRFAIDGWPVDCVRVALRGLEIQADWVLSGINAGGNLGADVYISGTVAAVREAALLGVRGVAFSHYRKRDRNYDWSRAGRWVQRVFEELQARPWEPGSFWNVNLPHLEPTDPDPPLVYCSLDPHPLPVQYRREGDHFVYCGDYQGRPRVRGADVEVCFSGSIAITQGWVR